MKRMKFSVSSLDFCAPQCNLLQCGSDTAALLGRFLPRLGPLATASGPFFLPARELSGKQVQIEGEAATPPPRGRAVTRQAGFRRGAGPILPCPP
jgi:hypothetical protein